MSPPTSRTEDHDQRPPSDGWTEHLERMEPADLRLLALSLPLIEQAKGILMGHYGCDATTAFTILRRWSSAYSLKLRAVATALVDEASREVQDDGHRSSAVERFLSTHRLG